MYFQSIEGRVSGLIGYVLCDSEERVAVVVDPPPSETNVVLAFLGEHRLKLHKVLRTHAHEADADHCGRLCALVGAESGCCGSAAAKAGAAHVVFGSEVLSVLRTPGHTSDSVSYLWRDRLICGDLFDFGSLCAHDSQSDPAQAFDSLTRRIFILPDTTLVFPAHPMRGRRVATLAELKMRYMPLLNRGRDEFITSMLQTRGGGRRPAP